MAHDVFICYSSPDSPIAELACEKLELAGIRCWVAPRDPIAGSPYGSQIISAIETARLVLLILSQHVNSSDHVMREVEAASDRRRPIVPLRVDKERPTADLEYYIKRIHWLDATKRPIESHLDELVRLLQRLLAKEKATGNPEELARRLDEKADTNAPAAIQGRLDVTTTAPDIASRDLITVNFGYRVVSGQMDGEQVDVVDAQGKTAFAPVNGRKRTADQITGSVLLPRKLRSGTLRLRVTTWDGAGAPVFGYSQPFAVARRGSRARFNGAAIVAGLLFAFIAVAASYFWLRSHSLSSPGAAVVPATDVSDSPVLPSPHLTNAAVPSPLASAETTAAAPTLPPSGLPTGRFLNGMQIDVANTKVDGNNLSVLFTVKNTEKHDALIELFTNPAPFAIDNNGTTNMANFSAEGIPQCGGPASYCAEMDATHWLDLRADSRVSFVVHEIGRRAFDGSTFSLAMRLLLAFPPDGGGPLKPTILTVNYINLPLRTAATPPPIVATRIYDGIRFDVLSFKGSGQHLSTVITAVDTESRMSSLKIFTNPVPEVIDNAGTSNANDFDVLGVHSCGGNVESCSVPDPATDATDWSRLYSDSPLVMGFFFTGTRAYGGTSADLTFNAILSVASPSGGVPAVSLIQASIPSITLTP